MRSLALAIVLALRPGSGVSKMTWTGSDPHACLKFFDTYLAVAEPKNGCANQQCTCATQGRVSLEPLDSRDNNFGVHVNNCTQHPYGQYSTFDIDQVFAEQVGLAAYSPFLDYHLALWTNDLPQLVAKLAAGGEQLRALAWKDNGAQYYSVLVRACGQTVLELVGNASTADRTWTPTDPRHWFSLGSPTLVAGAYLTPLHASRATASLDAVVEWYEAVGAKLIHTQQVGNGRVAVLQFPAPKDDVHLQFWEREAPAADGEWTVAKLERFWNDVHNATIVSPVCGFDQWMDNHIAYDADPHSGTSNDLDALAATLDKQGKPYRWWKSPGSYQIYAADPTGWSLQFDGSAASAPANTPMYSATCESVDGCAGQGQCGASPSPSPSPSPSAASPVWLLA